MKDNVLDVQGTEVYTHSMLRAVDEYKALIDDEEMIYKPSVFNGCIKYIYLQVFKPDAPQLYNSNTKIDTGDTVLLNNLWDAFTLLCARYGHRPTVIRFSILTGITMETFNSWERMEWRNNDKKHSESIKRWKSEAENALVDGASESNSIGSIFLLKSNFGYRETSPLPIETESNMMQLDSPEQIMQRHSQSALEMPVKPNLD